MKNLILLTAMCAGFSAAATHSDVCLKAVEKSLSTNLGPTLNEVDFIQAATPAEAKALAQSLPEPYRQDALNLIGSGAKAFSSRVGYADTVSEGIQFHLILRNKACEPLRILKLDESLVRRF